MTQRNHWSAPLRDDDVIIAAWGERCSGPGWTNRPIVVLVRGKSGELRLEWIQPAARDATMTTLFGVSALAMEQMTGAVRAAAAKTNDRRGRTRARREHKRRSAPDVPPAVPAGGGDAVKYRKKPIIIEATRWWKNGDHPEDDVWRPYEDTGMRPTEPRPGVVVRYFRVPDPAQSGHNICGLCERRYHDHGWIDTLEGGHIVCPGDWVITGVAGERYPCKPAIFDATYEAVE